MSTQSDTALYKAGDKQWSLNVMPLSLTAQSRLGSCSLPYGNDFIIAG